MDQKYFVVSIADTTVYDKNNKPILTGKTLLDSSLEVRMVNGFYPIPETNLFRLRINELEIQSNNRNFGDIVLKSPFYNKKTNELVGVVTTTIHNANVEIINNYFAEVLFTKSNIEYDKNIHEI